MLHEIQEPSTAATTCCDDNCAFGKFANWFKPRATALVHGHIEKSNNGQLFFVKVKSDVSLYDIWFNCGRS